MKFPWTTSIVDVLKSESKLDDKLQHITKSLVNHKEDISKVVEELGPALTHKDVEIRLKATQFLSDLLREIPNDLLDDNQIKFITTFYCDRMKDHHSIAPQVIVGLLAIVKMKNFPRSLPVLILQQLFANIPCQSQVRGDRSNIFSLLQFLSDNFQVELEAMGADYIYGVIQAVEGERDPRNLVFLFEYMPRFIATFSLRHLTEEMFEVFSCYFPIDFHPSPNDPQAITRDVLAEKLSVCLCASKGFALFCFPLALEKLEGELKVAKLDSLNLLIKAAANFEPDSILENFDEVWDSLKKEIFSGNGNKEVHMASLKVIAEIIKRFKDDQTDSEIVLNKIFTTTIGTLLNRDSKLYVPTLDVILSCASASDGSYSYVMNKVLPITLNDLTSNEELTDTEKCEILKDLIKFLSIGSEKQLLNFYSNDNYVLHIQKEIMKLLMTPSSDDVQKDAWIVFKTMASIVSVENRQILYKKLNSELMSASKEQSGCLLALAKANPDEVFKLVLESYIKRSFDDHIEAKNIFTTLSTLLEVPELREHIIEVMCLNVFHNKSSAVRFVVLEVIHIILSSWKTPEIAKLLYEEYRIVVKLIDLIKNEKPSEGQDIMYEASIVMNMVVRTIPADQQMALVDEYLPQMYLDQSISDLYITSGLLGFLDASVPMEAHFEQLTNELLQLSLNNSDEKARKLANQLLCSLFNRAPIDDKHRKILHKIFQILKDEIKKHKHNAVEILGWISKGLLTRGHPDAAELLETLADLLDHPNLSEAAQLAFEVISLEYPNLHLPLLKHLFKQKIFVFAMKFLDHKVEKFSEHHLTAMAHILKITPHAVLKMNIEKVGPILVKCIQMESDGSKPHEKRVLIGLRIINNFILDKSQYILNHLQHLVYDLLKLIQFKASMEVRIAACQCLENITKFALFTLVPYKNDVIHDLAVALDDHKRLVRSAAVSARLAWYLLGENEESKAK